MIIRLPMEQIATSKRSTQGVRLIKLNEGQHVATIAIVPKNEVEEFAEGEEGDVVISAVEEVTSTTEEAIINTEE